jgi:hypothetical protein
MAHLAILVSSLTIRADGLGLTGLAQAEGSPGEAISWETVVPWDASAAAVNQACQDTAIAAAELAGVPVGPEDTKLLFAGAQTLLAT